MTFKTEAEREEIRGVSGGILPVYREDGPDEAAACSCQIGSFLMDRYGLRRYDALPGTSPEDTKHTLVMAHGKRMAARFSKLEEVNR